MFLFIQTWLIFCSLFFCKFVSVRIKRSLWFFLFFLCSFFFICVLNTFQCRPPEEKFYLSTFFSTGRYSPSSYDRHTVKPHVCDKCGRSYAYKGSFLNHITECGIEKVETVPTPRQRGPTNDRHDPNVDYHYCPMCNYCTAYRWNLKKHVQNRHPEIPAEKIDF